ncbi:hypothetical protein JZU61_01715, partial [bacterium]|nr:hypothetical protein [bacterium]
EEVGGNGFTQNAGNLDYLVDVGGRINDELERLQLLSEGPDLELMERLAQYEEAKRPPVRKRISPLTIIEDELAEMYSGR